MVTDGLSPLGCSQAWPPSAQDAAGEAAWWTRYALDRAKGGDGRLYHPGFVSHLEAARIQLDAVVSLGVPEMDQRRLAA